MYISTKYLHVFLDIGDALLSSGAEIFRVEDTLNRMGYACGATQMNVFVITSSIVITMEFPEENVRTQTRRIRKTGGNDFEKLEKLNHLSRQFCQNPMSPEELREVFDQIDKVVDQRLECHTQGDRQDHIADGLQLSEAQCCRTFIVTLLHSITGRISRHLNLGSTETYKKVLHE